jgi:hypothetical protein
MSYSLKENGSVTLLEITQGDFAAVENGQQRYEHSQGEGNDFILAGIKKLAEAQPK